MPSEDKDTQPKKRRGAQPGNLNALKHGFYSKAFRASELEGVQEIEEYDLAGEIDLLRLIIKRTAERAIKAESFNSHVRFLSVLTYATAQLSRLLSIQQTFASYKKMRDSPPTLSVSRILQEYRSELERLQGLETASFEDDGEGDLEEFDDSEPRFFGDARFRPQDTVGG